MNEYLKKANDFLEKAKTNISITFIGKAINSDLNEKVQRNKYSVTIKNTRGEMTFDFWDSIYNTEVLDKPLLRYPEASSRKVKEQRAQREKAMPDNYGILTCLTTYNPGLFEEFCAEYGYDEDSRSAEKIYNAVIREYLQLKRLFTSDEMDELREIP